MLVNDFKAVVKSVLGSCVSLGILVESKDPREVIKEIDEGKYDEEIKNKSTEPNQEKIDKLSEYFEEVKKEQEAIVKEIEEKAAKEAEAALPGAAPGEGEAAPAEEEKKEEK
jgi:hypothetical protein